MPEAKVKFCSQAIISWCFVCLKKEWCLQRQKKAKDEKEKAAAEEIRQAALHKMAKRRRGVCGKKPKEAKLRRGTSHAIEFLAEKSKKEGELKKEELPIRKRELDLAKTNNNNIRDFKIHYSGLLLRLVWPWGTRLTTPFPLQTSNRLRFNSLYGNGLFSIYLSYKNGYVRLYSTFIWQRLDQWQWFPSLVSILHLPEHRFALSCF